MRTAASFSENSDIYLKFLPLYDIMDKGRFRSAFVIFAFARIRSLDKAR